MGKRVQNVCPIATLIYKQHPIGLVAGLPMASRSCSQCLGPLGKVGGGEGGVGEAQNSHTRVKEQKKNRAKKKAKKRVAMHAPAKNNPANWTFHPPPAPPTSSCHFSNGPFRRLGWALRNPGHLDDHLIDLHMQIATTGYTTYRELLHFLFKTLPELLWVLIT